MVKRKILALGLLIISALCTFSACAELNYLNVSLRSGTVDVYALAEKPVISVVDGATILIKSPEVETTYNVGDIVSYSFSKDASGVIDAVDNKNFGFKYAENLIEVTGDVKSVALYDIQGRILKTVACNSTLTQVRLDDLNAGVYVVVINNQQSIKIVKK